MQKRNRNLNIDRIDSMNARWKRIQNSIKQVSAKVLGKPKKTKKSRFNERCENEQFLNDPT